MFRTGSCFRRYVVAAVALAAAVGAMPTSVAQSDKWWPGYGNGPDNSRYFASRQINKANVNQLRWRGRIPTATPAAYPSPSTASSMAAAGMDRSSPSTPGRARNAGFART